MQMTFDEFNSILTQLRTHPAYADPILRKKLPTDLTPKEEEILQDGRDLLDQYMSMFLPCVIPITVRKKVQFEINTILNEPFGNDPETLMQHAKDNWDQYSDYTKCVVAIRLALMGKPELPVYRSNLWNTYANTIVGVL